MTKVKQSQNNFGFFSRFNWKLLYFCLSLIELTQVPERILVSKGMVRCSSEIEIFHKRINSSSD